MAIRGHDVGETEKPEVCLCHVSLTFGLPSNKNTTKNNKQNKVGLL